jgi:hypothetical protein
MLAIMQGWIGQFRSLAALRKVAAATLLLAFLLPSPALLAGAILAAELPACCNASYCPLHHRQASDLQRDKSICGSMSMAGHTDCSMRACDEAPRPTISAVVFVLVTPPALRAPGAAEAAPDASLQSSPSAPAFLLTPPPRPLLS